MLKNLLACLVAVLAVLPTAARCETPAATSRPFYSIDYTVHPTFKGAVLNSFAPTSYRENVGAVLRNTYEPLNPVRYVGAVAIVELQKQIASGEGIDPGKIIKKMDPAGLAGGYFGAQIGEALGAVAQTALARSCGPIGGTIGFALRPILWLAGSSVGGEAARSIVRGDKGDPVKAGMAKALREFNPIVDSVQMIGDNVGGVIGQAMIPIPFVGLMCGAAVGGVAGLLLGKAITQTGPGKALDESLRTRMKSKADQLAPEQQRELEKGAHPSAAVTVPRINGTTAPPQAVAMPSTVPAGAPAAPVSSATVSRPDVHRTYLAVQEAMRAGDQKLLLKRLEEYRRAKEGR